MAYNALDISKYIVSYCTAKGTPISNLKLQKMLYYTWIEYYKKTKKILFYNPICAWQLGPVVPDSYYEFCAYAGIPITKQYSIEIDYNDVDIMNSILDDYIPITASTLVKRSHEGGKPWDIIYQNGSGNRKVIPFDLIILKECA